MTWPVEVTESRTANGSYEYRLRVGPDSVPGIGIIEERRQTPATMLPRLLQHYGKAAA